MNWIKRLFSAPDKPNTVAPGDAGLTNTNPSVRLQFIRRLNSSPTSLDLIASHLAVESDRDVRYAIYRMLAESRDVRVIPFLLQDLEHSDSRVEDKRAAIFFLSKFDEECIVPTLAAALKDTNPLIRESAIFALMESSKAEALETVRKAVVEDCARLIEVAAGCAARQLAEAATPELDLIRTQLVLLGLQHPAENVRMETLREFPDAALRIDALLDAVRSAETDLYDICRSMARRLLVATNDLEVLRQQLASPYYADRSTSLKQLATSHDPGARNCVTEYKRQQKELQVSVCEDGRASDHAIAEKLHRLTELQRSLVGECLWAEGGIDRMTRVAAVYKAQGGNLRSLESLWNNIGTFRE